MIHSVRNQVTKLFTLDLFCRRTAKYPLLDAETFNSIRTKKYDNPLNSTSVLRNNNQPVDPTSVDFSKIGDWIRWVCPTLYKALEEFPYNLFLAGGTLASMFSDRDFLRHQPTSDLDIFIVAENAEEAERITLRFANILHSFTFRGEFPVKFHPEVVTFKFGSATIQLIRRVYPRRDLIVGGFDIWPSQGMWSVGHGFECTPMAAFSYITLSYPEDVSKRSPSADARREKYINKGYRVLLLGYDGESSYVPDCMRKSHAIYTYTSGKTFCPTPDEPHYNDPAEIRGICEADRRYIFLGPIYRMHPTKEDYGEDNDPQHPDFKGSYDWSRWLTTLEGKNVKNIVLKKYGNIYHPSDEEILQSTFGKFADRIPADLVLYGSISAETVRRFFPDKEKLIEFTMAYNVEGDLELSRKLWLENLSSHVDRSMFKVEPLQCWRTKNPEAQTFGQNNPTPMSPRDFYGPDYIPTYVGISHETYFILKCWWTEMKRLVRWPAPNDVWRFLLRKVMESICEDIMSKFLIADLVKTVLNKIKEKIEASRLEQGKN